MMKKIFALVITLFVILLMALTCPDKKAHTEAIRSAVSGYVNETLSQRQDDGIVMGFLGSLFVSKMTEIYLDNSLEVSNYLLFSVGRITFDGTTRVVSVGAFNHVFTSDKDDIRQALQKTDERHGLPIHPYPATGHPAVRNNR